MPRVMMTILFLILAIPAMSSEQSHDFMKKNTVSSLSQRFHDDHMLAQDIFSQFDPFQASFKQGSSIIEFSEFSGGLKLKTNMKKTYENKYFQSIQFLSNNTLQNSPNDNRFIVQLVSRDNQKSYFLIAEFRQPEGDLAKLPPYNTVRIFTLKRLRLQERTTKTLEERANKNFDDALNFFSDRCCVPSDIIFPSWKPKKAPIGLRDFSEVAISLKGKEDFLNQVQSFNQKVRGSGGYLFDGSSNELLRKAEPYLRSSVITPICNTLEQISGHRFDNGVAAINVQPYSCIVESLGSMKIAITRLKNIECKPGSCSFSASIHCSTQAGALQRTCKDINTGLNRMFGKTDGVPAIANFMLNGEVSSVSASIR